MSAAELDSLLPRLLSSRHGSSVYEQLVEITLRLEGCRDKGFPATAVQYLKAFSNPDVLSSTRRWAGLALRKMMDASPTVAPHLEVNALSNLGMILLHPSELEETKIVAGVIIRLGLEQGIEFASFWPTDKVPNSAPFFPKEADDQWMGRFQEYLDAIVDLKIAHTATDPGILYPVSLSASDGFRWTNVDAMQPTALVQDARLTIVSSDVTMQDFVFVDIPAVNIKDTTLRKSQMHDSQARESGYEPWETIITFKPAPWTYHVNASDRSGDEFVLLFRNHQEAEQCRLCLQEMLQSRSTSAETSSGSNVGMEITRQATKKVSQAAKTSTSNAQNRVNRQSSAARDLTSLLDAAVASSNISTKGHCAQINAKALTTPAGLASRVRDTASKQIPTAHAAGVLSKVTKPIRSSASARQVPFVTNGEGDDFDFPDDANMTMRPPAKARKGRSHGKSKAPAPLHRFAQKTVAEAKLKTTTKPRSTERTEDEEAIEDSIFLNPQNAEASTSLGKTHDDFNHITHKPAPATAARVVNAQEQQLSKPRTTASLPTVSKHWKKSVSSSQSKRPNAREEDEFSIPMDEEPTKRLRKRRRVVKSVDYTESGSSDSDESGSDYVEPKSSRKMGNVPLNGRRARAKPVANSKGAAIKSRRGGSKKTPSLPPLVSQLFSEAKTNPQQLYRSNYAEPSKASSANSPQRLPNKTKSTPQILQTAPSNAAGTTRPDSAALILDQLNDDDVGVAVPDFSSPLVDHAENLKALDETRHVNQDLNPERQVSSSSVDTLPPINLHTMLDPPQDKNLHRRQTTESSQPSTPQTKRHKTKPVMLDSPNLPTTVAPPRILEDPMSPTIPTKTHTVIGRTPMSRGSQREHSSISRIAEILSSNSKPLPAPPSADSMAISGHVDSQQIIHEKARGECETAKSNPFSTQTNSQRETNFTRRLTQSHAATGNLTLLPAAELDEHPENEKTRKPVNPKNTQSTGLLTANPTVAFPTNIFPGKGLTEQVDKPSKLDSLDQPRRLQIVRQRGHMGPPEPRKREAPPDLTMSDNGQNLPPQTAYQKHLENKDVEDDETLVAQDDEEYPDIGKTSPPVWGSSPPRHHDSPDSHSSTSVDSEPEPEPEPPIPSEEAEEAEWEASLQPHQRAISDQLIHISRRLLRHIVDNETAVNDIVDAYGRDGQTLLDHLIEQHKEQFDEISNGIELKKGAMKKELDSLASNLRNERGRYEDESPLTTVQRTSKAPAKL